MSTRPVTSGDVGGDVVECGPQEDLPADVWQEHLEVMGHARCQFCVAPAVECDCWAAEEFERMLAES